MNSRTLRLLAVTIAGLSTSALNAASVEERLAALEKRVEELTAENKALRTKLGDDGKAPLALVRPGGKATKLSVGGFLHLNAETGGVPDARWNGLAADRFLIRRARINFNANFAEGFALKLEGDFGNNSLSNRSGYSAQLTDVYVQWTKHPEAMIRVGQFKTPFGYEQLMSDTKAYAVERSLPNDRLTVGRQIGAMLLGDVAGKRVNYSLGLFNGNGVNNGANDNEKFMVAGRIGATLHEGKIGDRKFRWSAGLNAFTTEDRGTFAGRKTGWGADTQVAVGAFELNGEWLRNDLDPLTGADTTAEGWSLLGAWTISPVWQVFGRFETYDSNTALGATTTDEWTAGVNYLIKGDDLKLGVNYLWGQKPGTQKDEGRLLSRLQVMF